MKKLLALLFLFLFALPQKAFAHEAYVLTNKEFMEGLKIFTKNPFGPLVDGNYAFISFMITVCVVAIYVVVGVWSTTSYSAKLDKLVKKLRFFGPLIIRLAISSSFFFAAQINSVLGPELSLDVIAGGEIIRILLFAIAIMVFFGVFVELAAAIGLVIFFYISLHYGIYMFTYANYFGELLVLLLFGSRFLSIDNLVFGKKLWFPKLEKFKDLEVPIVRVLYGAALIYAAIDIKFIHQTLSVEVYNQYHLVNYFHASPDFIAAGAGLSEFLIGFFILIGVSVRITVIISLIFITLSLLYFHEMLWPHLMLYGISLSLIINSSDKWSLESRLIPWARKVRIKLFGI